MSGLTPIADVLSDHTASRRLAQLNMEYTPPAPSTRPKTRPFTGDYRRTSYKNEYSPMAFNKSPYSVFDGLEKISAGAFDTKALKVINNTAYMQDDELVLPDEITSLIDNKSYMNRHKKLARENGVEWLLKLAEIAKTKGKPNHWYAKVTSCKQWQQTEKMLLDLFKRLDYLKEKLQKLGIDEKFLPYYLKAKRQLSEYKFNRCLENAAARGVIDPYRLFAKSIKCSLDELAPATA